MQDMARDEEKNVVEGAEYDCAYELTEEYRRRICIRVAAKAVIYSYGGAPIDKVAVAPIGATNNWSSTSRRGTESKGIWGICHHGNGMLPLGMLDFHGILRWDDKEEQMIADKKPLLEYINHFSKVPGYESEFYRQFRVEICGLMAGDIADAVMDGVEDGQVCIDFGYLDWSGGLHYADGLCRLLPFNDEWICWASETERLLRTPEIWHSVLNLADELERVGCLGGDDDVPYLPVWDRIWPEYQNSTPC